MRVLFVTPSYAPAYRLGGPIRSLEGLVRGLRDLGVNIRVVTTDAHGPERLDVPKGWTTRDGVPIHYLRRWAFRDATPLLALEAEREAREADVVHVTGFFCLPTVQGILGATLHRKPVFVAPRGALEPGSLRAGAVAAKRAWITCFAPAFRRCTFHVTSEKELASVQSVLGPVSAIVVPNATDIPASTRPVSRVSPPAMVMLGRIHPSKRCDRAIEALRLLRARGVEAQLRIAGPVSDPAYHASLLRQREAAGLESVVTFCGEQYGDDKADFLRSARVLILCSDETENFGNVVPEALAVGTPVVAVRTTPWSILEERGCGAWTDADPASIAAAAERYLRDEPLAIAHGAAGRRLVEEKFTWPAVARQMFDAFTRAMSTRH